MADVITQRCCNDASCIDCGSCVPACPVGADADLAVTDIAGHALDALRRSRIRDVVVLGPRSPLQAAYTGPELLALSQLPGVDLCVDPRDLRSEPFTAVEPADISRATLVEVANMAADTTTGGSRP